MSDSSKYTPPKVWKWDNQSGGKFTNINRPIAGATHEQELPVGKHPLQLYSLGTPNGIKITVLLEELLALGHVGAEYDAFLIKENHIAACGGIRQAIEKAREISADKAVEVEVESLDELHQGIDVDFSIIYISYTTIDHFRKIVWQHVGRHTNGNTTASIDQQMGDSCR